MYVANKEFGQKLKKARKQAGYTQKDIYEKIKVPQSTFSSWEIGKSEPDANTLLKLCQIYNVDSFTYFVDEKQTAHDEQSERDEMRQLIEDVKDLSEEDAKKTIEYIEFLKSKRNQPPS